MPELIMGGHFLTRPVAGDITTPEGFSDEQRAFMRTARGFVKKEVVPQVDRIEAKDLPLLRELIGKAGDLGLLMTDIPEAQGGLGLDKTTSMILAESMNGCSSWAVTYGAQVGIGMQPIVFFGDEAQKQKYLPRMGSGEWVGAYALTEAGAGSDAMGIKTRAVLDGDHYVLNGTKQWITNAGIADVFTVFAKVDGSKFTAFIVERGDPGVSVGPEEHKLGLRGSSTCELILEDARIPKDRVLGRIGRGHRIAFGILYMGRLKLGVATIGGTKDLIAEAVGYAQERRQFDRSIIEFGLIREKLARVAARLYACEAMGYRTAGLIDRYVEAPDPKGRSKDERVQLALEEYGIEAAILKIYGSELMDEAADEAMQIFGGYGYTEHFAIERIYRDSRINRIFEGTNEINRLLVAGNALRKSAKGKLPLDQVLAEIAPLLASGAPLPVFTGNAVLDRERHEVQRLKQLCAYAAHTAVQHNEEELDRRQDLLGTLADLITAVYAAESAVLRTAQMLDGKSAEELPAVLAMTRYIVDEANIEGQVLARRLVSCVLDDQALEAAYDDITRLTARPHEHSSRLLEIIAAQLGEDGGYKVPA